MQPVTVWMLRRTLRDSGNHGHFVPGRLVFFILSHQAWPVHKACPVKELIFLNIQTMIQPGHFLGGTTSKQSEYKNQAFREERNETQAEGNH